MSNVLRQYYQGITQQLRSEVDFINSLFLHQGLKGGGNEAALRDLISKFIPKRFGIGTGVVIDQHGQPSRQCDIIIYDTLHYPSLLSLTSVHLYPVDFVYATIEVKTTLTSKSAREALENIASVKSLDYVRMDFGTLSADTNAATIGLQKTTAPVGVVFAYNSDAQQDETFRSWFIPNEDDEVAFFPSLVGCLDMGMVGFKSRQATESVLVLHPEKGVIPECATFPVVRRKQGQSEEPETVEDIEFLKVSSPGPQGFLNHEGIAYPIKKIGKDYMAIDQSRILLMFLLQLNELLRHKRICPNLNFMGTYTKPIDHFHYSF